MKDVQDRIVQFSNRYKLTNAETGEVLGTFDFDEVTGTVQQVGTEIDKELFDSIAADLAARVKLSGGELAGTIVTFSDISGTAANVASGDTSATLWGKVKNWFSRLKALAFKNKVAAGDFEAGAIKNADVATDAAIAQSKVSGLMTDYVASISVSGRTVTYKNKNGVNMGSITTQDTTYGLASQSSNGLMSSTDKTKLDGIESGAQKNTVLGVKGSSESAYRTGNVNITKENIGLGNVDNTSDSDKPVSTATQMAIDLEISERKAADRDLKIQINELDEATQTVNAVKYVEQSLTPDQKSQARTNISAASVDDVEEIESNLNNSFSEILQENISKYSTRQTANGSDIFDGALTQVESIQGDTIATSEGLKNAFFSSITSETANLLGKSENYTYTRNGITFDYNAETGIWTINGTTTVASFSVRMTQLENWTGSQDFSMLFEKIGGTMTTSANYLFVSIASSDFSSFSPPVNEGVTYRSFSISANEEIQPYYIVIGTPNRNTTPVTFNNYQFRCMVQKGTIAQQDMAFQLYGVTDTLSVSTPIELTKYDTAYPAENKVVRGGATLTQETPFTEEQLAQYSEYVLSQDGMTIVYKLAEPTEETVVFNKFFYRACSGGIEYITQGATDNSKYGAECTVTQKYVKNSAYFIQAEAFDKKLELQQLEKNVAYINGTYENMTVGKANYANTAGLAATSKKANTADVATNSNALEGHNSNYFTDYTDASVSNLEDKIFNQLSDYKIIYRHVVQYDIKVNSNSDFIVMFSEISDGTIDFGSYAGLLNALENLNNGILVNGYAIYNNEPCVPVFLYKSGASTYIVLNMLKSSSSIVQMVSFSEGMLEVLSNYKKNV